MKAGKGQGKKDIRNESALNLHLGLGVKMNRAIMRMRRDGPDSW